MAFGKKEGKKDADIDVLKQRFAQLQGQKQNATGQQNPSSDQQQFPAQQSFGQQPQQNSQQPQQQNPSSNQQQFPAQQSFGQQPQQNSQQHYMPAQQPQQPPQSPHPNNLAQQSFGQQPQQQNPSSNQQQAPTPQSPQAMEQHNLAQPASGQHPQQTNTQQPQQGQQSQNTGFQTRQQQTMAQAGAGRSPLEALNQQQGQQGTYQDYQPIRQQQPPNVNVVEVEGQESNVVGQQTIVPGQQENQEGKENQEGQRIPEGPIEESLEELKEEYDDAKLNSIIIEQVKELIEIDNNLNNKIEDIKTDLKKEVEEREKLEKKIDDNYGELKELEKSIDKFIALYELITNQFNPFVKKDDAQSNEKMGKLMGKVEQVQAGNVPQHDPHEETDFHFVTKTGERIKNLKELIELLQNMPQEEFEHHVTPTKNDFAAWIEHALHNEELGKIITPIKEKETIINKLKEATTTLKQTENQGKENGNQEGQPKPQGS